MILYRSNLCTMTTNTQQHQCFASALAASLCTFASKDTAFAMWFTKEIRVLPSSTTKIRSADLSKAGALLIPADRDTAVQRAYWVLQQANTDPELASQLQQWAAQQPVPQALVLGIIGVDIPGPTLGIIKKRKKHSSVMPMFVCDETYRHSSPQTRFTMIQQTSLQLLSKALRSYGGDTQLDPDFFDWLHHDQLTSVGRVSENVLQAVQQRATDESILFHQHTDGARITALAITPAVSDEILDEYNATRIV